MMRSKFTCSTDSGGFPQPQLPQKDQNKPSVPLTLPGYPVAVTMLGMSCLGGDTFSTNLMSCSLTPPAGATLTHSVGFIFSIYRQQLSGWTSKEVIRTQTKLGKGWEWSEARQCRKRLRLTWEWGEMPMAILRLELGTELAVPWGAPLSGCPWRSSTVSGLIYPSHPVPDTVLGMEQQQNRKAVPGLKEFIFWQKIHR